MKKDEGLHGLFRAIITQRTVAEKRLEIIAQGRITANKPEGVYFEDGSFVPHTAYDVCLPLAEEAKEEDKQEEKPEEAKK